jgi:hypothetical protein
VDYSAVPAYGGSKNILDLGTSTGDDIVITNGDAPAELPENTITLHQDGSYSSNYIQLRSAFDFASLVSTLTLGIDTFTLHISNYLALTIGAGFSEPVVFRRNISTTTRTADGNPVGMLENSVINATTTGTTTLTIANAFATIVNTPTLAGRIFVLPAPTAGSAGFWYAICNKSTDFTINVQYPALTTIATIPVASSGTNGGSVARFAVTAGGTSYFAVDSSDRAITATNIAGGLGGQIPYQTAVNTTALLANGTAGQYLKSNGTTLAPSWVNQNLAATPSGLPTTVSTTNANQILTVNFNSSFSSVTNYTVNFTGSATTTQTINAYTLSGGVAGGQYNVVIQLTCSGGGTTTWTFNGTGLATTQKTNFVTITTTAMTTGTTRYVVLTFAYDGTNYFISGSNFA